MTRHIRDQIAERPNRISTVTRFDKGSITDDEGWSIGLDTTTTPVAVGSTVEYWGKGIGFPVRGLAVDGVVARYMTEEEHKANMALANRRRNADKIEQYVANKSAQDAEYDDLAEVFRRRIDRFRAGCPEFRWEFEPYELRVCNDAQLLAETLGMDGGRVDEFSKLKHEEQRKLCPSLVGGHSGNSYGCMVQLAYLYCTQPEAVVTAHGAMVPLVGCVEYGCTHEVAA